MAETFRFELARRTGALRDRVDVWLTADEPRLRDTTIEVLVRLRAPDGTVYETRERIANEIQRQPIATPPARTMPDAVVPRDHGDQLVCRCRRRRLLLGPRRHGRATGKVAYPAGSCAPE